MMFFFHIRENVNYTVQITIFLRKYGEMFFSHLLFLKYLFFTDCV